MELRKSFYVPLVIFLVLFAGLFCLLGYYNWGQVKSGEDFGFSAFVAENGVLANVKHEVSVGVGRYFGMFLVSCAVLIPLEIAYKVLPAIIVLIYAACVWIFIGALGTRETKNKILITAIITASTLAFLDSLHETLYWICAAVGYFGCTAFFILGMALAVKALQGSRVAFCLAVVEFFLTGTILEQPCIFQGGIAFFAMIYYAHNKDKRRASICRTL